MVPGMRKRGITPHWGCMLTVAATCVLLRSQVKAYLEGLSGQLMPVADVAHEEKEGETTPAIWLIYDEVRTRMRSRACAHSSRRRGICARAHNWTSAHSTITTTRIALVDEDLVWPIRNREFTRRC